MSLFSSKMLFDKVKIEQAITELEQKSSAELRVYIEPYLRNAPVLERAFQVFCELNMQQTQARNAVLIYVAYRDHRCSIIGDEGIHRFVGDEFWQATHQQMLQHFKQKHYTQGIVEAIETISDKLAQYFPIQPDDINELPNEVIIND